MEEGRLAAADLEALTGDLRTEGDLEVLTGDRLAVALAGRIMAGTGRPRRRTGAAVWDV